jgi:hypothetical protein
MIYDNLLKEDNKNVLDDLIERCNLVKSIDVDELKILCELAAKATNIGAELPGKLNQILNRWYISLEHDSPDYTVYAEDEYIAELWACWKVYSKTHLINIQKPNSLFTKSIADAHTDSKVIVDLGCGFSYTTAALTQIFPKSQVFGTNLDNTLQMAVARTMAKDYNFTMKTDASEIDTTADLVFASEYFEHFDRPIEHLDYIVETINPGAMLIANAFGPTAIGHFKNYSVKMNDIFGYESIPATKTSTLFNSRLKYHGYTKEKTKLWNSRPAYWVK